MRRLALAAAVILAAVTNLWAQGSGQLPAWNVLGNPSAAASNARSASLNAMFNGAFCSTANNFVARVGGSWVCQGIGTGLSFSGGNLNITNTIVAGGPTGSATVAPILTWNAQGQLTVVSSATIAPAFASITGTPTTLAGYGIASPLPSAQGGTNNAFFQVSGAAASVKTYTFPNSSQTIAALDLADQTVSGGANVTTLAQSTGNITVDCGARPIQTITNGGAFTITAPTNPGYCVLDVTNNASAGAITFSGFSVGANVGDTLTTTNTNEFFIFIYKSATKATYSVKALQ